MDNEYKILNYLFSPFFDNKDSIEMKNFVREVMNCKELSDKKIHIVQFRDNELFKKKMKLDKSNYKHILNSLVKPSVGGNYDDKGNEMYLYVDNWIRPIRLSNLNKKCCYCMIVSALFHEFRHQYQYSVNHEESFDLILCDISSVVTKFSRLEYKLYHDKFFMEIDANCYGVDNSILYFEKYSEMNKYYDQDGLYRLKKKYEYDRYLYDFDNLWRKYNMIRKFCPKILLDKVIKKDKNRIWHRVFYGNSKELRDINDIVNDENFSKVDSKFINYVFTSRYFNELLDYSSLSDELIQMLLNEFESKMKDLIKKIEYIKNAGILKQYADIERLFCDQQYYYEKVLELSGLLSSKKSRKKKL